MDSQRFILLVGALQTDKLPRIPVDFHSLPPELLYLLFCHCDRKTLGAGSLVCKDWLAPARHHLFSTVRVSAGASTAFVTFLESESGTSIRPSIQSLSLATGEYYLDPAWLIAVPKLSVYLQPSTLTLSIHNNTITAYYDDERGGYRQARSNQNLEVFRQSFKTVTCLELSIYCDTFVEAAEVICSFPLLETLILEGQWFLAESDDEDEDAQMKQDFPGNDIFLPITVHTIHLPHLYSYIIFLRWLCAHEHLPLTSTLVLDSIYDAPTSLATIGAYLRKLGRTLQALTMKGLSFYAISSGHINLETNIGLRKIDFHNWRQSIETAFHLMSQIRSFSMEEIEFAAWYPTEEPDNEGLWSQLDTLLATPQYAKLRWITVNVNPDMRQEIEDRLPIAKSRNGLRFRSQRRDIYY